MRRDEKAAGDDDRSPSLPGYPVPAPFLLVLGYRRITKKTVLASSVRNRVFSAIAENPGLDAPSLAALLTMNINTLRYHLFTLAREEKITFFSRPGTVRYFVNNGLYPPFVQCLFHHLRGESTRKIILALAGSPGMTREELATILGIAGPSVTRHIRNLSRDGIVAVRTQGRFSHHYLTPAAFTHPAVIDGCFVHPRPGRVTAIGCSTHRHRGSPAET
jgi:predicted transcriptional regulator